MFNFSIISLISIIFIYQNIFLLNEETLILICFIVFFWITFTRMGSSIHDDLRIRASNIEDSLIVSLNQLLNTFLYNLKNQKKFQNLPKDFETLGNHFFKLSSAVSNQLPVYLSTKSESIYEKKFVFIRRLEKQTIKLLALLLVQKLNKLVTTQKFCTYNLKIPNFLCFQTINLLKYFKNI